jgi:methionyl-tRNA formyltransferase
VINFLRKKKFFRYQKIIIIGFSQLSLRLYKQLSPNIDIQIIYSQREFVEFKNEIRKLKNYKIYKTNDIENYLKKNSRNSNTAIFSLGSTFIFNNKVTKLYKNRLFNCHNTDLPNWKGGGDISYRIMNRSNIGATTVHLISSKIDKGDIVFQKKYKIKTNNESPLKLKSIIENKAFEHLKLFFNNLLTGKRFNLKSNDERKGFYLPRLNTDLHGLINWEWDAKDIVSFINAFSRPYKGAFCFCRNKKIRIFKIKLIKENFLNHPFMYGLIFRSTKDKVFVVGKNKSLVINKKDIQSKIDLKEGDRLYVTQEMLDKQKSSRVFYSHKGKFFK